MTDNMVVLKNTTSLDTTFEIPEVSYYIPTETIFICFEDFMIQINLKDKTFYVDDYYE